MYNGLDEIIDLFEAEDDVVLIGDSHNLAHSCNRVSLVKVHTEKLVEKVISIRCDGHFNDMLMHFCCFSVMLPYGMMRHFQSSFVGMDVQDH
jgi:hypothetical protein